MTTLDEIGRESALRNAFRFTFENWRGERRYAAAACLSMCAATLADVFVPLFAGQLIDAVATYGDRREEGLAAALAPLGAMAGLGLSAVALRWLGIAAVCVLTLRIMSGVTQRAFARVQHLSTDWHANAFSGSVVRQITRGAWALDLMHDTLLMALLPSAFVLAGTIALLGLQWPALDLMLGIGAFVYVVVTVLLSTRWVAPAARVSNAEDSRVSGTLADALGCNAVVKAFGAEDREEGRLAQTMARWQARTAVTWRRATLNQTAQTAILWAVRIAIAGGALFFWSRGQATPGDVAYVLTTYFVIHGYLRDIGMHVRDLQKSVNEMEEMIALLGEVPAVRDDPQARPIAIRRGEVRFEHVDFRYGHHATPLYDDLDVTIEAGQRVGLVGRSGSGKTTFVKLVQRLYDVSGGRVTIDGEDIRLATQCSLRRQIAIVPQEPILFHRSLADNIAYGRPGATREDIERAAALASADGFIARLPQGLETMVGERGVKLSGGERQRIALARAFLADAPILILDEATSSLDSESEAAIQAASERLMQGRTALVIAHRLSTVRSLDRILVFDRGRIVEDGSHAELLHRPGGHYRQLSELQSVEFVAAE
ncbi:ABC transporter ATP-binding protein [Aureimonas leprariae]|uniref:ABC transporter ATP-binding protein n=1 Tax=Plantimonas leprariae TaxID=2615207 RepID=A0A7V7PP70_9HYPH|nr:ABC transporter ATP-binding protein [Aureimonas leprariae]KAB0679773.1 ABC transporter ATP-binding protein [Aureimonas leprariae]